MLARNAATALITMMVAAFNGAILHAAEPVEQAQIDERIGSAKSQMVGAPAAALEHAQTAEILIDQERSDSLVADANLATALWLQAEALNRLNSPSKAKPILTRAFQLAGTEDNESLGQLMLTKGRVARALGEDGEALQSFQNAYRIFTSLENNRYRAISLQSIATLYDNARQFEKVIDYNQQASDIYSEDDVFVVVSLNNRANAFRELKRYEEAKTLLDQALRSDVVAKSDLLAVRILTNLARLEFARNDLDAAETAINQGLARSKTNEASQWLPILMAEKARLSYRRGNLATAENDLQAVFSEVHIETSSANYKQAHDIAYRIFHERGDAPNALLHLEAYKRLDDAERDVAASANLAILNAEFELSNKELEIATLRSDRLEADVALIRAKRQQERLLSAGGVLIAASLIGFLVWQTRQSSRVRRITERLNEKLEHVNRKLRLSNGELEKANLAKTEFLATTSHEVRTPLNAVINLTQVVLQETPAKSSAHEKLSTVLRSAEHLHEIVSDVLDVARFEGNRVTPHMTAIDAERTISDVVNLWQPKAEEKGLRFGMDIDVLSAPFLTDEKLLRQVLSNLLSNAIKFTDKGSVELSAEGGHGTPLTIRITDTGIGIDKTDQDIVFESFRQADSSGTRSFSGTGLGLAICRKITELLGGTISVESYVGEGSTFIVTFPSGALQKSSQDKTRKVKPLNQADLDNMLSNLRVLAAEDNAVNAMVIQAILKEKVKVLTIVENGAEAVEAVSAGNFDLVLMDKQMPVMDGVEATKRIRAIEGPPSNIPIIAVTADAFAAAEDELLEAGADDYLSKPIKPEDLKFAIVDTVRRKETAGSAEMVV